MIFMQGHSSRGVYARAYLEGRLNESHLQRFRHEVGGGGLSSYPHPWLMPDFWQFPTVSMGLGPMMAIYQARFLRYMENRGMVAASDRKVWHSAAMARWTNPSRWVRSPCRCAKASTISCSSSTATCSARRSRARQRKIIQELEAAFLGAGWNVIKVLWGRRWDPLLAKDINGVLHRLMENCVDGEYQNFKAKGGAYTREHFFGKHPETAAMVANMSDDDIWRLKRGGHDEQKVYAAYAAAIAHKGQPTVILAHTVKGFGLGKAAEGQMVAHQQKKMDVESLASFRSNLGIQLSDEDIASFTFRKPAEDSEEIRYLKARREALGVICPAAM